MSRQSWRWYGTITAAISGSWLLAAVVIVPRVIRSAYAGDSFAILNGIIGGRDTHPVERYLAAWAEVATLTTVALAVVAIAVALLLRFPGPPARLAAAVRGALPELASRDVLILAVFFGLLAGLAEATRRVVSYRIFLRAAGESVSGEIFWMSPLAAVLVFLMLAVGLILVATWKPARPFAHGFAPFAFAGLAVYSLGRSLGVGIHPLAVLALSVGVATAVTRFTVSHPIGVTRSARRFSLVVGAGLAAWAIVLTPVRRGAEVWERRSAPVVERDAPNVVLIVWDTVRALSLSLYGRARETTPNLDALADHAVVFDQVTAAAPWTLPSHASLFTGRYHHEHSARHDSPLDGTYPTLADVLAARGYQTGGFVANEYWGGAGFGLQRGFQWYQYWKRPSFSLVLNSWWISGRIGWGIGTLLGKWRPLRIDGTAVNRSFLEWVDRRDESRPFFAFLNFFDAHEPYLPPEPFGFEFSPHEPMYQWRADHAASYTPTELAELRDAYESCILYLDHQLRLLLDELNARGILDNTLVVLTSDHGETLGDQSPDLLGHENNVYYNVLNVPLVFYFPERLAASRIATPVSLVDVPRTVMEILEGPGADHPFPGHSLMALGDRTEGLETRVSPSLAQAGLTDWHRSYTNWPIATGPLNSLLDERFHYVVNAGGDEQLFDISTDVWESTDLVDTDAGAATARVYRQRLDSLLAPGASR
jgi:arylsulfatase A-like enzyme